MYWNLMTVVGAVIVIIILIPNIIYAFINKNKHNKYTNKVLNILEQIGRYGSMLLMLIGFNELGFWSKDLFAIWLVCMPLLLILYWLFWAVYFKLPKKVFAMLLAIIPSIVFILHGVALWNWLLVIFGAVFAVSHILITSKLKC